MKAIDYNSFAHLYDLYTGVDYDFEFFCQAITRPGLPVLELTSGTGRLSIPLIEAGADLTCVDISQGMLDVLQKKLEERGLQGRLVCSDLTEMKFDQEFDLAILPFQSFMELIGEERQKHGLSAVYRALKPGGRFFCTMHNPVVRGRSVDGLIRPVGTFPLDAKEVEKSDGPIGTLVVSGVEQGGDPVVRRNQFYEFYDANGILQSKRLLKMEFQMISPEQFESMAQLAQFEIVNLFGNYDHTPFNPEVSPVMIWELRRGA